MNELSDLAFAQTSEVGIIETPHVRKEALRDAG